MAAAHSGDRGWETEAGRQRLGDRPTATAHGACPACEAAVGAGECAGWEEQEWAGWEESTEGGEERERRVVGGGAYRGE